MSGVIGDLQVSDDGRSLVWESDVSQEWIQRTRAEAGFSVGTYLYNKDAGFPSVTIFSQALSENEIGAIVKAFILGRPRVAEVPSVQVAGDPITRAYVVRGVVRLSGQTEPIEVPLV